MPSYKQYELKPKKKLDGGFYAPEKRWMVKGYLGLNEKTGLPKYTTLRGFERKSDAKEAFLKAVQAFKESDSVVVPKMRLNDVYDQWWPMYVDTVSPSTAVIGEIYIRNHVLNDLGDYFIDQITILDLQKWVNRLAVEQRSWDKCRALLNMMLNFSVRMRWLDSNPMQYVEAPHRVKASNHVKENHYSLDEVHRFVRTVNADAMANPKHKIRQVYLLTVLYSGARAGEALALKWSDIDWTNRTLHIQRTTRQVMGPDERIGRTKTEEGNRYIAMDESLVALLKSWRSTQGNVVPMDGWLFPSPQNHGKIPLTNFAVAKWLINLQAKYGLRRITLHGLRHTKATLLAESGVPINDIAAILGHTDSSFTLRTYVHATRRGIISAEERYSSLLQPGSASGSQN